MTNRTPTTGDAASPPSDLGRAARWLLAVAGVASFGLAAIGAVLPGLPTTIFVLIGSFFLTKSCPWLERRLVQSPLFRPYVRYLNPHEPMPRRAKVVAISAMWTSIAISAILIAARHPAPNAIVTILIGAGAIGTLAIVRFRRRLDDARLVRERAGCADAPAQPPRHSPAGR